MLLTLMRSFQTLNGNWLVINTIDAYIETGLKDKASQIVSPFPPFCGVLYTALSIHRNWQIRYA